MDDTDMMIVDAVRRGYQTAAQVAVAIDKDKTLTRRHMESLVRYGMLERCAKIKGFGKAEYYYKVRQA